MGKPGIEPGTSAYLTSLDSSLIIGHEDQKVFSSGSPPERETTSLITHNFDVMSAAL
jgi:hypothetical protein